MGEVLLVPLSTGIILHVPSFQAVGNTPVNIERLQKVINGEAMLVAVHFSILAEMPSVPTDLVVSRLISKSKIATSVQSSSSGQSLGIKCSKLYAESLFCRAGKSRLKQLAIEVVVQHSSFIGT